MDDDRFSEIASAVGDDYDLISELRKLFDWSVLVDVLGNYSTISEAKVAAYEQHGKDLKTLKDFIGKYIPEKYNEVFRGAGKNNYSSYVYHTDAKDSSNLKKANKEDFSKYMLSVIKNITPDECDKAAFDNMVSRLELRTFMPKQKNTDNRVIPHQLYWYELNTILKNAENYLPFLKEKDSDGITVSEKIISVFLFKIPYFVGPLNSNSERAWIQRKADGKIYPWNADKLIDFDASENEFIRRMTNTCTYLPGEDVLPKDSLLYQKFSVLNTINNIRINDEKISVELKQLIYNEIFLNKKKVTRKRIADFLVLNGFLNKGEEEFLTGIDANIGSTPSSHIAFRKLISSGDLTEADAERIIERASYAEDKSRLLKWLTANYPDISEEDRNYIGGLRLKDFGRLSRKFLAEIEGADKETGEVSTIIEALWNTQNNLMELLSDKFTFTEVCNNFKNEYYTEHKSTLEDRLNEMYISNAVKRPIYRTLDVIGDVVKAFGVPKKIFVETTRSADESKKGKRTKTRKQQILELYEQCKDEDVRFLRRQLEDMGEYADNKLRGDKLFLYYMQLGKSMYSGTPIPLESLASKDYDIDHIYPQAFVKDDSIINNKVLVLSSENGAKSDIYPIAENIRSKMHSTWEYYRKIGLISEEKFKRLTRSTPFTDEEKHGFINRQLTETSQSTKAVATLLKERFPDTEIVYSKARLVSEFRQEFDLLKSRTFNDLHHAVDAYLNIVVGNVYNMKFTKSWFNVNSKYSIKTRTIFTHPQLCNGETVWDGEKMLEKVKATAVKNTAHFTKYSYFKHGGFFDQQLVSAAEGLTPIKKGLPTEKYGGYNRAGAMFY
ncbi:MAG: type II CRISPR RNA-guided endonuclease Cas9, partial [Ruminococcus sp.]|nr:type II CRISPR RNA-guided endonuclease Cas9 [Candidatus Copronaster equi]